MEPVMRILPALFILTTLLIFSKGASAETVQIEFTKFDTYSIEVVHILAIGLCPVVGVRDEMVQDEQI